MWAEVAYWMIVSGIVGGLVAAVSGWIGWFAIRQGTRAKRVGLIHGVGNVIVLALFAISLWMRSGSSVERNGAVISHSPDTLALILSLSGLAFALITGWLGGELVECLGIGIDDGANWNAPNSLSGRPTSEIVDSRNGG